MPICSRRPYCFDWECISRFLKNGATPASFCLFSFVSNTISYRKIASFSGIQTQMASTLTTTAHVWVVWRSFYIKSILTFLFSRSDANKLFNILLSSSLVARPQCDRMVRLFFNILPFVAKKISQICQSILSNLPNTRKLLQSTRKLLLKWRNFAKSGHTARPQKYFPFLKKLSRSRNLFSLSIVISGQLTLNCHWLDSNCRSLILEVTTAPAVPHPLPIKVHPLS